MQRTYAERSTLRVSTTQSCRPAPLKENLCVKRPSDVSCNVSRGTANSRNSVTASDSTFQQRLIAHMHADYAGGHATAIACRFRKKRKATARMHCPAATQPPASFAEREGGNFFVRIARVRKHVTIRWLFAMPSAVPSLRRRRWVAIPV